MVWYYLPREPLDADVLQRRSDALTSIRRLLLRMIAVERTRAARLRPGGPGSA
jgi:hypothetical protein